MTTFKDWLPQGVIPAVLLPFKPDFSIDAAAYRKHLRDTAAVRGVSALTVNGHSRDVTIAADGAVLEIEEQVALDSLPAAVREGLQKKAGAGKIQKIESLTKGGKLVAYEAVVLTGKKRSEIQVGPEGKDLAHPE